VTAAPHLGIVSAVQHLQAERDALRDLLQRINDQAGETLPTDLRTELQHLL